MRPSVFLSKRVDSELNGRFARLHHKNVQEDTDR
jgi:hypothetical protein